MSLATRSISTNLQAQTVSSARRGGRFAIVARGDVDLEFEESVTRRGAFHLPGHGG